MSGETAWKVVNDRQQSENLQRQREEQLYKQKLRNAYMAELTAQMQLNQQMKQRDRSLEKWQEKQLIQQSLNQHQHQIDLEHQKARLHGQREERVEQENEMLERKKR